MPAAAWRRRATAVLGHTLQKPAKHFPAQLGENGYKRFRRRLKPRTTQEKCERKAALAEVTEQVRAARRRVVDWPVHQVDFTAWGAGVKRVYKKGRKRLALADQQPNAQAFHEWRKQVKNLWYQLTILNPLWPRMLSRLSEELKKLADCLNDEHDLASLQATLKELERPTEGREMQNLLSLIERRRAELQRTARYLGKRIYAEMPGAFVRRLRS